MRVIVNLTQFVNTQDNLIDTQSLAKYLGYTIVNQTIGIHKIAKHEHYHTMMIMEFRENEEFEVNTPYGKLVKKKAKIYKTLNKTINDIMRGLKYKHTFKVSFKYENGIGKELQYDETALQYPFKEYSDFSNIDTTLQIGYTEYELRGMWQSAHAEWKRTLAKRLKEEQKEKDKADKKLQYKEYLEDNIGLPGTCSRHQFSLETYDYKIRTIIRYTLDFHKINQTNFRMHSLKDDAINFLFHHNLLSTDEILYKLYV